MQAFEPLVRFLLAALLALAGWFTVRAPAQVTETPPAVPTAAATPAAAPEQPAAPAVDGRYTGQLAIANLTLDIVVMLTADGAGGYTGAIDIPQQGATGIPLQTIVVAPPTVSFAMLEGAQQAIFEGEVADDGSIRGVMRQSGFEGTFTLTPEAPVAADVPAPLPAGTQSIFASADGQYTVPIPTNWQVEESEGYVKLADPDGELLVYLAVTPTDNMTDAIESLWALVDPAFDLPVEERVAPPAPPNVDEVLVFNYKTADPSNHLVQALGMRVGDVVHVQLYDVTMAGLQRRGSQLNIISSGYKITDVEETDLSGVQPLPVDENILAELEPFITSYLEEMEIPGAVVGIVQDGEVVYAKGFGVADPATGRALTPQTPMMIGSVGKSMTTMLMGTLVDDGLMTWDTPAVALYPDFRVLDPELSETITMRNLVCACTGVPRRDLELAFNFTDMTAEDTVASLADFEFFTDFGEAFQYSNQMVGAAGYIAGRTAAAQPGDMMADYAAALQERVLDPIGMTDTTIDFDAIRVRGDYAIPHGMLVTSELAPIGLEVEEFLLPIAPAGGHWSTLDDMLKYMVVQLNDGAAPDGAQVVSAENLLETRKPQIAIDADTSYGLGWMVGDYKQQPLVSHGGNSLGFSTEFTFLPEADLGIVVITNGQGTNFYNGAVVARLLELVFEQPSEITENLTFYLQRMAEQRAEAAEKLLDQVDAAAVTPFVGLFANDALGEIELTLEAGELFFDTGDFRTTLLPFLDDEGELYRYVMSGPPLAGLTVQLLEEEGAPVIVVGEGAVSYRFTPVE